jgi:DNA/RNA non-specific endonuclease
MFVDAAGGAGTATLPRPAPATEPPAQHTPAQKPDTIEHSDGSGTTTAGLAGAAAQLGLHTIDDSSGKYENVANGKLPPNASIVEKGYTFTTDGQGRVASASGKLALNPNAGAPRDAATKAAQKEVGWDDRLSTDHGGHLIGDRFNGPGDLKNLFAQDGNFNLGEYKKLENGWAKELGKGRSVDVNVNLSYPKDSLRPTTVDVSTKINGKVMARNIYDNAPGGKVAAGSTSAEDGTGAAARDAAEAAEGSRFARGAEVLGKVALPVAVAADAYSLYGAYKQDGDRIGKHTVEQAGSVAGGWAGAAVGAEAGGEAGAAVGALFGGVGAVPGAIIGGAVGGVVGGLAGSAAGKDAVKLGEGAVSYGKKAVSAVANFFGF